MHKNTYDLMHDSLTVVRLVTLYRLTTIVADLECFLFSSGVAALSFSLIEIDSSYT